MPLDPFNLSRFLQAQKRQYPDAVKELRAGRKRTHWIWFVFPQLRALGRSSTAHFYGLEGFREAYAYWRHPILGTRLRECVEAMLSSERESAADVLGEVDALKFRSCLTLFLEIDSSQGCFQSALDRFYEGRPDALTLDLLRSEEF